MKIINCLTITISIFLQVCSETPGQGSAQEQIYPTDLKLFSNHKDIGVEIISFSFYTKNTYETYSNPYDTKWLTLYVKKINNTWWINAKLTFITIRQKIHNLNLPSGCFKLEIVKHGSEFVGLKIGCEILHSLLSTFLHPHSLNV